MAFGHALDIQSVDKRPCGIILFKALYLKSVGSHGHNVHRMLIAKAQPIPQTKINVLERLL